MNSERWKRETKEQTIMLTHRQDKGGKVSLCVTLRGERETEKTINEF